MDAHPQEAEAQDASTPKIKSQRHRISLAVILLVAAAFVVIRSRTGLVFDDTPGLGSIIYDWKDGEARRTFGSFTAILCDSFTSRPPIAYRPLSHVESRLGCLVYLGRLLNPTIFLCLTGLVHGAAACSVLCVARSEERR